MSIYNFFYKNENNHEIIIQTKQERAIMDDAFFIQKLAFTLVLTFDMAQAYDLSLVVRKFLDKSFLFLFYFH